MKTEAISTAIYNYLDIPPSITKAIKSLFDVQELTQLSLAQKKNLKNTYSQFFNKVGETNYRNISKEYTLRYFPANFFKIWAPIYDLLIRGQIKENCSILELGCGPGSSTMGFIEFYRILNFSYRSGFFYRHDNSPLEFVFIGLFNLAPSLDCFP